jgi:hypothetical protein
MTPAQCRAARALLDMTVVELARAAAVPVAVIVDYETSLGFAPEEEHLDAIRDALEKAGIEFTAGERPWVKLRKGKPG